MIKTVYLVVRADGDVRVAKRPRIAADEVAMKLNVTIPDGWGRVVGSLDVVVPEPPAASTAGDL